MTPYFSDDHLTVYHGDVREVLREVSSESVHCVVTSPPYFGLRDYGEEGQIGLEPTPEAYVASLVAVFREVRRVLRGDGTLWLNLGDSYSSGSRDSTVVQTIRRGQVLDQKRRSKRQDTELVEKTTAVRPPRIEGLKPKDMIGIPWMVAFALRADGWYLRSDVIWSKLNPMPESVVDRPTKSHEYLFLLSKSPSYYYNGKAIQEPISATTVARLSQATMIAEKHRGQRYKHDDQLGDGGLRNANRVWEDPDSMERMLEGRNARTVWTIATEPYPGAHFATFPQKLVEPCIKAGCPEGGVVLDPFAGSGTTGLVAQRLSRKAVLIDISMEYLGQLMQRNSQVPLGLVDE